MCSRTVMLEIQQDLVLSLVHSNVKIWKFWVVWINNIPTLWLKIVVESWVLYFIRLKLQFIYLKIFAKFYFSATCINSCFLYILTTHVQWQAYLKCWKIHHLHNIFSLHSFSLSIWLTQTTIYKYENTFLEGFYKASLYYKYKPDTRFVGRAPHIFISARVQKLWKPTGFYHRTYKYSVTR